LFLFFVLTVLFTVVVPLIYLSWLWMTGKKWPSVETRPNGDNAQLSAPKQRLTKT
jgi:hypothetical protein